VETDECGAPEFFSNGTKVLLAHGQNGKLHPAAVESLVLKRRDIHYPKPRAASLSTPTELGTVYQPTEIADLLEICRKHGLRSHMDGARFAHAVATLGCQPADITWRAGLDVLCFGGTKLGISLGEAIVFFNKDLAAEFSWRCKQAGQLASKMRFLSATWSEALGSGVWLENARTANARAKQLEAGIRESGAAEILYPVEANSVFLKLPESVDRKLREKGWGYYIFIGGGARLMCSWATTEDDVRTFLDDLAAAAA
jgi:threonine aldolase